ncbi:hypothetical protein ACI65C_004916 [Semiaphis heraclei]
MASHWVGSAAEENRPRCRALLRVKSDIGISRHGPGDAVVYNSPTDHYKSGPTCVDPWFDIFTSVVFVSIDRTVLQIEHNHAGNNQIEIIENFKNEIKSRSRRTCDKPSQIFAEAVSQIPVEALLFLPKESIIKRTIRNQRTSNNPALNSINDVVIEDDWALVNGQQDNGFYWLIINQQLEKELYCLQQMTA